MSAEIFDRFTGLAHARDAFTRSRHLHHGARVAIVNPGKNLWCVERALTEQGARIVPEETADALVVGSMSPGPILDCLREHESDGRPVIAPWRWDGAESVRSRQKDTIAA